MNNLIVVAGHAIVRDINLVEEDAGWFLLDFQSGEPVKYIGHIERAVQEAATDPSAMLLFSGGPTRIEAGPRTESLSYWLVAEHLAIYRVAPDLFNLTTRFCHNAEDKRKRNQAWLHH